MTMTRFNLSFPCLCALALTATVGCGREKVATTPAIFEAGAPEPEGPPQDPSGDAGSTSEPEAAGPDAAGGADGGDDATAGGDGAAPGSSATADVCERFCAVLLMTGCPPDATACRAACADDVAGTCATAARAEYGCEAERAVGDFACDARGRIRLNAGICEEEQAKFVDCLLGAGG